MAARCSQVDSDAPPKPSKHPIRLQMTDLFDTIVANDIKCDEQLYQLALREKEKGNNELANFIISKDEKRRNSVLATAWKMQNSSVVLARKAKTRIEIMEESRSAECVPGCDGKWYAQAEQTLNLNQIDVNDFCTAVKDHLEKGRGKN